MTDKLVSVGWVALDDSGKVLQPMKREQWYNKAPTKAVRKLYETEGVAKRYGTPKECFIKEGETE